MTTQLLSLTTCPYCKYGYGHVSLNVAELPDYPDVAPSGGLRLHEMGGQKLLVFNDDFNDDGSPEPCPHLLMLYATCDYRPPAQQPLKQVHSVEVHWWHPLRDERDGVLIDFVFNQALDERTPRRFKGDVPVKACAMIRKWLVSDTPLGTRFGRWCSTAYFTPDIPRLYENAQVLWDACQQWHATRLAAQH